jgi:hypothetical protein
MLCIAAATTGPSLHMKLATTPVDMSGSHFPTGQVSIEAVVRFLIEEMGVTPQRSDWQAVLDANEEAFVGKRSWA